MFNLLTGVHFTQNAVDYGSEDWQLSAQSTITPSTDSLLIDWHALADIPIYTSVIPRMRQNN